MSNTKEDISRLQERANAGDASAQNSLGCAYAAGDGVVKNLNVAASWFAKSAQQGYVYGQYNIGLYCRFGSGVKKDLNKAVEWYKKAAAQGYGKAAIALGEIYEKGYKTTYYEASQGIASFSSNKEEAFYWYEKAVSIENNAILGYQKTLASTNNEAKFNLARCYEQGIGTTICLRRAYNLYEECNTDKARAKQKEILKTFSPLLDTRLGNVSLLRDNPYRILGVWSNASEKEIRANQSKINAMLKVGKEISFPTDHALPCTYEDYIAYYTNKVESYQDKFNQSEDAEKKKSSESLLQKYTQTLDTWKQLQYQRTKWNENPIRDEQHISEALLHLSTYAQRIKFAFFWFCCITDDDIKGLNMCKGQKPDAASALWCGEEDMEDLRSFSARINIAMQGWQERYDNLALELVLPIIHDEKLRKDFLTAVCPEHVDISETELSHIFFDALYEIPETELSWREIDKFRNDTWLNDYLTDDDKAYIESKSLSIIRRTLDEALQFAERQDKNDFDKSRDAYYKLAGLAPYQLLRIKRYLGEEDYRYKLICDNIAAKLLEFAIHYNNNNKTDWDAPSTALYLAQYAERIAVDPTLHERCRTNISIFKKNKKISTTDKLLETIDKSISSMNNDLNIDNIRKLINEVDLSLQCLCTEHGKDSEIYLKTSDTSANRILNVIVNICNNDNKAYNLSVAKSIINILKGFTMTGETKERLDKNERILNNNRIVTMLNTNKPVYFKSQQTSLKENSVSELIEIRSRRIRKLFASLLSLAIIAGIICFLTWGNNWYNQFILAPILIWSCISLIFIISLFIILLWVLEAQIDPYDSDLDWLDIAVEKLDEIAQEITCAGVQGSRTYSWPFAIPFQILAIVIFILKFPLGWIAKLATLIK